MQNKGRTKNAGNKRYDRDRVDTVAAAALVKNPEKRSHAPPHDHLSPSASLLSGLQASMQIKRDPSSMQMLLHASLRRDEAARYAYGAARVCFFPVRAPTFTCPSPPGLTACCDFVRSLLTSSQIKLRPPAGISLLENKPQVHPKITGMEMNRYLC